MAKPSREDKSAKTDYTLIPIEALDRLAKRFAMGNQKYSRDDWQNELKELGLDRYKQSLLRHTIQYVYGHTDEDHLSAVLANAAILAWAEKGPATNATSTTTVSLRYNPQGDLRL